MNRSTSGSTTSTTGSTAELQRQRQLVQRQRQLAFLTASGVNAMVYCVFSGWLNVSRREASRHAIVEALRQMTGMTEVQMAGAEKAPPDALCQRQPVHAQDLLQGCNWVEAKARRKLLDQAALLRRTSLASSLTKPSKRLDLELPWHRQTSAPA